MLLGYFQDGQILRRRQSRVQECRRYSIRAYKNDNQRLRISDQNLPSIVSWLRYMWYIIRSNKCITYSLHTLTKCGNQHLIGVQLIRNLVELIQDLIQGNLQFKNYTFVYRVKLIQNLCKIDLEFCVQLIQNSV